MKYLVTLSNDRMILPNPRCSELTIIFDLIERQPLNLQFV